MRSQSHRLYNSTVHLLFWNETFMWEIFFWAHALLSDALAQLKFPYTPQPIVLR